MNCMKKQAECSSNLFRRKYFVTLICFIVTAVCIRIAVFQDDTHTIKRTVLSKENILLDLKIANRTEQCGPFAAKYEHTVGAFNRDSLFHYEKEFTPRCFERIEDQVWVRTYLPGFRVEPPLFADNRSEYMFHRNSENTVYLRVQPIPRFTEVLFLRNGTYEFDKFCGYKGTFDWIKQNEGNQSNTRRYPVLAPVLSFDGFSFQHFLDGTIHLLVQILPFIQDKSVKILTYPVRDRIIFDFIEKLNISRSQIIFHERGTKYQADLMIYSCMYDRLHPMLWHEVRTKMGVPPSLTVGRNKAHVVLITRDGCFKCGRRLLNQDSIFSFLQIRYGNDSVKVFKGPKTLDASIEMFSKARIVIGPHGGGLYNMVFAPYGTTIIEFMPTKENGDTGIPGHQIFWKIANNLHHLYWRVALRPIENYDMFVNLNRLTELLDLVDMKT